jgi:hypothetical protein
MAEVRLNAVSTVCSIRDDNFGTGKEILTWQLQSATYVIFNNMLTKGSLSCILAAVLLVSPVFSANVKGVAPESMFCFDCKIHQIAIRTLTSILIEQALYQVSGITWTCLDKSKSIPASAINDDYCDCPDGSDEPGIQLVFLVDEYVHDSSPAAT